MASREGVSVVICCYNSSARITATLEHLQKIETKDIPWEVVVVDNLSTDDTAEKALRTWNRNPVTTLKVVTEKNPGLMNARIRGVAHTKYSIVSFIDDDNWVEAKWIEKVYAIMQNDRSLAACGGSTEAVFENKPPSWFNDYSFYFAVGKQQENSGEVDRHKGFIWGAGLTVRKSAWESLFDKGFNCLLKGRSGKSLTAGEDAEICFALTLRGWNLWYDETLKLKHFIPQGRLNTDYLFGMCKGFGRAQVILSLYVGYINNVTTNKATWELQCLSTLKKLTLSASALLFSSPKERIKNRIRWNHDFAYAQELFFNRRKYIDAKEQMMQINSPKVKKKFEFSY